MTKYVLNSGGIRNQPGLKKDFHQEIIKGLGNNPKFLLCNFAQNGNDDPRGPINWEAARKELQELGDASLPVHALKEGEYLVVRQ